MELEAANPTKTQKRKPRHPGSRWFVYVAIALIIFISVAAAGWAYIRYDRGLVFTTFTDKDVYLYRELVTVTVEFRNYGFESVDLTFNTSALAGFDVYTSEGVHVCSIPICDVMYIREVTLRPGQSESFQASWNQFAYDPVTGLDDQVPPGTYYIVAGTACSEFHATVSTSTFEISGPSKY